MTLLTTQMGNIIAGAKKKARIMKIDGETFKLRVPTTAMDVLKDYPPGYVLMESEAVKKFGIRALELHPGEELKPRKLYFLIEMPKFPEPRTAGAGHVAHAESYGKERLEGLMLRQKSAPDVGSDSGRIRVKMRVPRPQVERLMEESKDEAEVAERILDLCLRSSSGDINFRD